MPTSFIHHHRATVVPHPSVLFNLRPSSVLRLPSSVFRHLYQHSLKDILNILPNHLAKPGNPSYSSKLQRSSSYSSIYWSIHSRSESALPEAIIPRPFVLLPSSIVIPLPSPLVLTAYLSRMKTLYVYFAIFQPSAFTFER